MKYIPLGTANVSNIILGNMRISDLDDEAIRSLVRAARDAGVTAFDHADIYGRSLHECETRFAEALELSSSEREHLFIQTKCGIVKDPPYYDSSYEHIISSVEASLRALRTDYIDLLLLHRPDALVEPTEVARAFDQLRASGKVRQFGVSNHTASQIEVLKSAVEQPLVANQLQLSAAHAPLLAQGLSANIKIDQANVVDGGGLLDYCRANDITVQAWSPFQGNGHLIFDAAGFPDLSRELELLAAKYDVEPIAVATAWITRLPQPTMVVIGSTNPARVADAAKGSELPLTRREWYSLYRAAGHILP
ncbi:aldo/keto reductase [Dactylosporangium fulvum]|uniref:Aldo/keto reductase n=1 Tax=Dactylosporangium fulvum TaxID=53359 RepID=A0ABY5W971_9ACTN|nr:aldo/keto reductase [Dactylosporangium fulvum]UWP86647.1 aldo/keto reductase [Dactylosporangium fulvum]